MPGQAPLAPSLLMTAPGIRHVPGAGRFEATVDRLPARLDYRLDGRVVSIHPTDVSPTLEGRGIASALTQAAAEHARAEDLSIRPLYSCARAWMQRHPEHADLLPR
jgi:predicted GNAT family acetyltransferase